MAFDIKIVGVSWSPRHANTDILVREALSAAEELPGVEVEFYSIAGKKMNTCTSKFPCIKKPSWDQPCRCYKRDEDAFSEVADLVTEADGILFGCPVYWMSVTGELKAFQDRTMSIEHLGFPWRNKVAGFLTLGCDRQGGQEHTIREMQNWAMMHDMVLCSVGPERPPQSIGGYIGAMATEGAPYPEKDIKCMDGVRQDLAGMYAARCVGWRVAELTKVVKSGLAGLEVEELKYPKGALAAFTEQQQSQSLRAGVE